MLCECTWENGDLFLGVIRQQIPEDSKEVKQYDDKKLSSESLNLLQKFFGNFGFVKSLLSDQIWLANHLKQDNVTFTGILWYPASFQHPEDSFEKVQITRRADLIIVEDLDHDVIHIRPLCNPYHSLGFEKVTYQELTDSTDSTDSSQPLDLTCDKVQSFHAHVIATTQITKPARHVQRRQIFYLEKLLEKEFLGSQDEIRLQIEKHLGIDILRSRIAANFLGIAEDLVELWNAFVVVVPAGKKVPAQEVHRDSLYESVSVFFYLGKPCDPQTGFFPFTHRLLCSVRQGYSSSISPQLKIGDVLFMNGLLCHYGMASSVVYSVPRILYIFQYRRKMKRHERMKTVERTREAIQLAKDVFPTTFNVN